MTTQLFSKEDVELVIRNMADEIDQWIGSTLPSHQPSDFVLLGLLNGGVYLTVDLSREISYKHQLDFFSISTYSDKQRLDPVIDKLPKIDLKGKIVLLVDDIVDSGETMAKVVKWVHTQRPRSIRIATLFEREMQNRVTVDFKGMTIPVGLWLIGRGMDGERGCQRSLQEVYCIT